MYLCQTAQSLVHGGAQAKGGQTSANLHTEETRRKRRLTTAIYRI